MDSVLSLAMEQLSLPSSVPVSSSSTGEMVSDFHYVDQPRLIPDEYIEELTKHISLYPNDTNVRFTKQS